MPQKAPQVRNRFSVVPNPLSPEGKKPAKQEFKDDADINSIMRKFQKTGTIDHSAKYAPQYGIASPHTLHESMNIVKKAESMFAELPSSIRKKFEHSAAKFLEFVQDEANYEEAKEIGLDLAPEAAAAALERMEREAGSEDTSSSVTAEGTAAAATSADTTTS